ncbi:MULTISPECIES: putative quinol monooxygenase [Sediminibacterium]|uniref:putative quinol monooxygenase n=1 Tax=Sediminibacterium TaxID=504481 RepID=UPI0003F73F1D|nr:MULTISPECIES: putative quinol monooxygenase [Sediminibacterium]
MLRLFICLFLFNTYSPLQAQVAKSQLVPVSEKSSPNDSMQRAKQMVRIAKIKVNPDQLDKYNIALKVQMQEAIKKEPGVLSYHAVADKIDPSNITILEIYASLAAYQSHIQTPHFLLYKETVKNMVQSLELIDVDLIARANKLKD